MTWNNDNHGLVCRIAEAKCYKPGHSWAMKLSQLHKQPNALVRIATYSLNADLAHEILSRRPHSIRLLCNANFSDEASAVKYRLPRIEIRTSDRIHAKLCLIAPGTVYLGSGNFVRSTLDDIVVGLRNAQVHDYWAAWFDQRFEAAQTARGLYEGLFE